MPRAQDQRAAFLVVRHPRGERRAGSKRRVRTGSPTAARWAIARAASSRRAEAALGREAGRPAPCRAPPPRRASKAGLRLDRMAEGVAEIEQGAPALGLALVAGDDRRLGARRWLDRMRARRRVAGDQGRAIRLAPGEEVRIADQAVFDDLGIAGAQLARGAGCRAQAGSISTSAGGWKAPIRFLPAGAR